MNRQRDLKRCSSVSNVIWCLIVATVCAGLFAGAAIYINAVEHPARLSCGTELAVREFAPSYHRATVMQVPLAGIGCIAGFWSSWLFGDAWLAFGAILLIAVVPFTLVVILPTNKWLLDPGLDPRGERAAELLTRWGRLHATRSVLSSIAFVLFLIRFSRL
jgi:Anthrone oxygenase